VLRQVLIGGSPSTGSSLLVNMLDRHPALSAGPETYLFIHPRLFTDWRSYKRYLLRTSKVGGLKSPGWFLMNGAQLLQASYGWSLPELEQLIEAAPGLPTFADRYMARRMEALGALSWVEKSPANVIAFPDFFRCFSRARIIHTTRDPYDAAASLLARGRSAYQAAGAYIVHTALALRVFDHPGAHLLRYEALVADPAGAMRAVLAFLGCSWEEAVLEPTPQERRQEVRMPGWLQDETSGVGTGSLGRFQRLPAAEQQALINALSLFRINPAFARQYDLAHTSLRTIAETLGYPYREAAQADTRKLKEQYWRDRLGRALRLYPASAKDYPGGLAAG